MISTERGGPHSSSVRSRQWHQTLSAGVIAYKLVANEALIYINMMYYTYMYACGLTPLAIQTKGHHTASAGC